MVRGYPCNMERDLDLQMRLRELVAEALESCAQGPLEHIERDELLTSSLDSVVLAALLVLIEEEWNIEISDDEIDPKNFESLDSIALLVDSKLGS